MVHKVSNKRRSLIFMNIIISCIASSMLMTALTTALPAVVKDLNIPFTSGHWLTSGYTLVMGSMIPLTAFLITRFPTKNLYLTSLGISIVGLFCCVIAPSFPMMMLARGLQACGSGITSSMGQVIILTIYPPEKRGTVMGWYGLSLGAAPALAPLLAGIIVDTLGWRAIFSIMLVIMAFSFLWAIFSFDNVLMTERKSFDTISFALSVATLSGITLGIGNISSYGITSPQVLGFLTVGIFALLLFTHRQLHSEQPFLDLRVFADKSFTLSVIGSALIYFVMMGVTMLLPIYLQSVCGHSATVSGLVKLPGSLLMAATSLFAGKIYDKLGIKRLFIVGALAMWISNVALSVVTVETSIWTVTAINLIYNLSIGCLMMPLVTWGVHRLSVTLTAHGSALISSTRTVAGSIGTAVFVGIMGAVTNLSTPTRGAGAAIYGFNMACLSMAFFTSMLLIIAIFFVKSPFKEKSRE